MTHDQTPDPQWGDGRRPDGLYQSDSSSRSAAAPPRRLQAALPRPVLGIPQRASGRDRGNRHPLNATPLTSRQVHAQRRHCQNLDGAYAPRQLTRFSGWPIRVDDTKGKPAGPSTKHLTQPLGQSDVVPRAHVNVSCPICQTHLCEKTSQLTLLRPVRGEQRHDFFSDPFKPT